MSALQATSSGPAAAPAPGALRQAAPVIQLERVVKVYETGDMAVPVLHGVSLTIRQGEFVAIMGASGSGKSTLMNILGCLDRPTEGRYLFRGLDVSTLEPDEVAGLRRDSFGFVFQSFNLIAAATALENVEIPAVYAGMPAEERDQRAADLLTTLGLGDRLEHRPNQLSGGQQQRVAIARALMNGAGVIFADEPTGSLDTRRGAEVMALLRTLNREGRTVVVITHEREVAEQADRLIEIRDGMVVADSGAADGEPSAGAATQSEDAFPAYEAGPVAPLFAESGEALRMALRSLRVNVFRTVLTLLGIVIGVGSVVAMLAVGDGAKQSVLDRIGAMGTNLLLVRPGAPNVRGADDIATLVPEDAEAIAGLPNVVGAVPERTGSVVLRYGNVDYRSQANGTSSALREVRDWPLASGSFIGPRDMAEYAPVVVLGQTVAETLYPPGVDPVGTNLMLNNVVFLVIGTLEAKGATPWGSDQDDVVFVPLTTGNLRLFGERYLRSITVRVDDLAQIDSTQDAVRQLLTRRHLAEDFRIRNMASIMDAASETQGTLTVLLGSIAAISLLVGGIGVMNIMLVSVTERTREIGIRMATGARKANILQQFMIEAVAVSALGGAIGVAGGLGIAWLLQSLGTPILFSFGPVALAFGCAFLTGLVFGFMPAHKAATLDPVVALGAE